MNNLVCLYDANRKVGGLYRVLVDVDLTLVDSLSPWVQWFNEDNLSLSKHYDGHGPAPFQPITKECYMAHAGDLAILMRERAHPAWLYREVQLGLHKQRVPSGNDPMDWWRRPDLYAKMNPLPGAYEFLVNLKKILLEDFDNVEFIAVSKCEPEHERSKRQFVYDKFPGIFNGFVSTDEKHLLAGDVLIDDNPKYVEPCGLNNIFVIFVPQGNYEKLDLSNSEDMLYIKPVEGQNHFDFLNHNIVEVVNRLIGHYQYVR
jgi:5'(3')-deoxyribonucleotidase